jgi:ADP-ribosylglycohydrolase
LVLLNERDFRDRVFACWLGKSIGGTLGLPFEGRREIQDVTFYTNLKPGEAAANDDLDLQLVWLKAVEEHGGRVDARVLGVYWQKYVIVDWNEYGVALRNMKKGLIPPLSGSFDNAQWMNSNGAWIRSEIWACLAPGCPGLAATMAREDACVDHGAGEGTLAAIFTASLESAAFIEKDRDRLIDIGLSMIPPTSELAAAIRAAVAAKKAGKDWKAAREDVIQASLRTGWFQAPRNVAFLLIGWLYGEGDFGRSLCLAVNCGDDTDCTAATLGALWGILYGTRGIPSAWSQPIGLKIDTVAIGNLERPKDLGELADRTVAVAKRVLARENAPVGITDGPYDLSRSRELKLADSDTARFLWSYSPWRVVWDEDDFRVMLDFGGEPTLQRGKPRVIQATIYNRSEGELRLTMALTESPGGRPDPDEPTKDLVFPRGGSQTFALTISALPAAAGARTNYLVLTKAGRMVSIPITLVIR